MFRVLDLINDDEKYTEEEQAFLKYMWKSIKKEIADEVKEYISKGGSVFMTTHVLEFAESMCTDVAIIHHGKILFKGSMKDIKKKKIMKNKFN
jgi:ABC-type multidrug transport system ATPase subunit